MYPCCGPGREMDSSEGGSKSGEPSCGQAANGERVGSNPRIEQRKKQQANRYCTRYQRSDSQGAHYAYFGEVEGHRSRRSNQHSFEAWFGAYGSSRDYVKGDVVQFESRESQVLAGAGV